MLKVKEIEAIVPAFFKNSDLIYVCVLDIEGQVYYASKKFEQLFETGFTEIFEKNFVETLKKGVQTDIHDLLMSVIEKPNHNTQVEFLHGNSLIKWEFSVLKNEEGDFSGILGLGHPKSNHYQIGHAESSFPKSVNPITDIFMQLDHSWEIVSANDQAEKYFNQKEENLLGKSIWQIYPDQNIYRFALEFKKAKESKTLRVFEDFSIVNGRWYKVYVIPRPVGLDLVLKDISEVQKLSQEYKQVNCNLQTVIENSEENIFFVGKDLRILGFNSKAEKLVKCHFSKNMKIGDKFLAYLMEGMDEEFLKHVERIFEGNRIEFEKEVLHQKYGEKIWFTHKFFPLVSADQKIIGFVYSCKDIHEEKIQTNKLNNQNRLMREILHTQSTTLRSPLSSILGLLELIDKNQLDKENKKYFSYLKPLAQELDQTIRNNSKQVSDLD